MTSQPFSEPPASDESRSVDTPAFNSDEVTAGSRPRILIGFVVGCVLCLAFIVPAEIKRWQAMTGEPGTAWLLDMNVDTTPFAVCFLLLPVMWLVRRPVIARPARWMLRFLNWLAESPRHSQATNSMQVFIAAMSVACVAAVSCLRVASTPVTAEGGAFGSLPPAYHDEYSYLFQAETFADGRLSFPSHQTAARIFDQMHVLNEGKFASRYFPGTGMWITPFLMLGNPFVGPWLATVIVCVFVFLIGRELACNGVGLLAGLLAAASPGFVLFGNILLAHQPTLVGLGLFIYSFLRMQRFLRHDNDTITQSRTRSIVIAALLSGFGLSFAMLCRPMTAAGVGLPFGIWIAGWLVKNSRSSRRTAAILICCFAFPLVVGFSIAAIYNVNTTGSVFQSPYGLYTELFTPRHMFGFNNVERAQPLITERTLDNYDRWALNLDADLAIQNVRNRLIASWQWTLGLSAVVLLSAVFVIGAWRNLDSRWWLIAAAIVSLHIVHVPYWYDGIFHWHYVFESGVLWCLLATAGVQLLAAYFSASNRPWMFVWVGLLLVCSVTLNNFAIPPFTGVSRLEAGINQVAFSRMQYFNFLQLLNQQVTEPALVLVRHDPQDRHIDYVSNHPSLTGPILIGRLPADASTTEEETVRIATEAFPERNLYLFVAATGRVVQIR